MKALFFRFLFSQLLGFYFQYFLYKLLFIIRIFNFFFHIVIVFSSLFTEKNSSWLIFEPIEALEIKTSIVFKLVFANKTILLCFLLIIDFYFLIPAVIAQNFIVISELAIPTGIPIKEAKTEIETHPVMVEAKISKCSV